MVEDIHRDVGGLLARVDALEKVVEKQSGKLDEVLQILHEARGGWKTLVMIGTVSAAVGGLVASLFDRIRSFGS